MIRFFTTQSEHEPSQKTWKSMTKLGHNIALRKELFGSICFGFFFVDREIARHFTALFATASVYDLEFLKRRSSSSSRASASPLAGRRGRSRRPIAWFRIPPCPGLLGGLAQGCAALLLCFTYVSRSTWEKVFFLFL
jgi:hypothetical protein